MGIEQVLYSHELRWGLGWDRFGLGWGLVQVGAYACMGGANELRVAVCGMMVNGWKENWVLCLVYGEGCMHNVCICVCKRMWGYQGGLMLSGYY